MINCTANSKAKEETLEGGWDAAARLTTIYGWLGAAIVVPPPAAAKFNEASMVRNVLLHRYGRLGPRDIARAPHLADQSNHAVKLTSERLSEYSQAVNDIHVAIMNGVAGRGWRQATNRPSFWRWTIAHLHLPSAQPLVRTRSLCQVRDALADPQRKPVQGCRESTHDDFGQCHWRAQLPAFAPHFGVQRAHLVGLSMGGRIAMRTALLHPDRIATLTLVDTHEGFEAFTPQQRQVVLGDIARIAAPAHFIVGADDSLTPVAMHHDMAAKMGGAPVSVLPRAGHLSNIENAAAFNQAALGWLLPRAQAGDTPRHWPA